MVPALVALAVLAVGALTGLRVMRKRNRAASGGSTPRLDPFTIGEPWRRHVSAALAVQRRYDEIVAGVQAGPLRERLTTIGDQVERAVTECHAVAARGDRLDDALRHLDVAALDRQLQAATDEVARQSITAQLEAAGRLRTMRTETDSQLRLLITRMGELTAMAAVVSVGTDTAAESSAALVSGVDEVLAQLQGLRLAMEELDEPGRSAGST
jgi:hypothetical protein